MVSIVQRSCPNCGAPVSPQHTLMTCEFCNAPLMVVREPPRNPIAPVPIAVFGAGAYRPRRQNPIPIVIAGIGVAFVGATVAIAMLASSPSKHIEPPPMPMPVPEPPSPVGINPGASSGGGVTGAGIIAMFETQCAQGDAQSCVTAGTLYEHGQMGVVKDSAKAKTFYERGCKLGNTSACSMAKSK